MMSLGSTSTTECMQAKILIVDDEVVVAKSTSTMLQEMGHIVLGVATTHAEALAAVAQERPDLVLMDINLGNGREGAALAEAIREDRDLPVVYVTAYADDDTLRRAKVTLQL